MTRGPGVPARRSCSRMYCCSSALTVCQSSRSSLATTPDRRRPTAPPHIDGKALGVAGIVGQERELLLLHPAAVPAGHAPDLDVEVDPLVAAGEIPDLAPFAVVPPPLTPPAGPKGGPFHPARAGQV